MSDKHNKMGNICAALCVIVCILLMIGLVLAPTSLFILLGIGNLIAGPACLVGYLIEVKQGVVSGEDEE